LFLILQSYIATYILIELFIFMRDMKQKSTRLLDILWRQRITTIFLVMSFLVVILLISPVLRGGQEGVFYSIDPEVQYMASALRFVKGGKISFIDHPGIPAIVLMSLSLLPLGIFSKLVLHTPFSSWAFSNYAAVFLYERIFQSVVLFASLLVSFTGIYLFTKRILPVFIFILIMLLFTPFYYLGTSISAEPLSFLMTSFWLLFFVLYFLKQERKYLFPISIIAGLAFANRATNFFIIPAVLLVVILDDSGGIKRRLVRLFFLTCSVVGGYILGIWPVIGMATRVLKQVFFYASTTEPRGEGEKTLFNLSTYVTSASSFFQKDHSATIIFLLISSLLLFLIFNKDKKIRKISLIGAVFILGAVVFAKYPVAYYQITNYFAVVFLGIILISRLWRNAFFIVAFPLLVIFSVSTASSYLKISTLMVNEGIRLDRFVKENPAKIASVWEWARTKEFAYIWTRNYSSGIFDTEMSTLHPAVFQFMPWLGKIRISNSVEEDVFDVCWDEMYIQNASLQDFLSTYSSRKLSVQMVPNSNLNLVKSTHCTITKP